MRLTELNPRFLKIISEKEYEQIDDINQADGISMLCPKCFLDEPIGPVGCHSVICWQPHVPQTFVPVPGRWKFSGTGYNDLTLTAGSSSIFLRGPGCQAHFFITNGEMIKAWQ